MKRLGSMSILCIAVCVALAASQYILRFEHGTLLGVDQDGWGGLLQGVALGGLFVLIRRRKPSSTA